MKKNFWNLIDRYVTWPVGILGVLLSVYCCVLQTEMFHWVSFIVCFLALTGSAIAGYALIRYFQGVAEKSHELRPVTTRDFVNTERGAVFAFLVSALLGFTATNIMTFFLGDCGMMMSSVVLISYKAWELSEKHKRKAEEAQND